MVRPGFIMRPPGTVGPVPLVQRPLIPGMPGLRPVMPPMIRPVLAPFVPPVEKPQTTIYIGKIATVENDFMMSILEFCGHVKSCLRAEDPTTKKPKGFGFYEFESAEGSLRAIRLLTKLTIDGQELLVNVNQATKEYLLKYVEKKIEKAKDNQGEGPESEREKAVISAAPTVGETGKDGEPKSKENIDIANSAVLTDEEREADKEAKEKIDNAIEERSKSNPLPPPPPPPPVDGSGIEFAFKSKDGDSNTDIARSDSAANDVETPGEHSRLDTSSPDWSKRNDRRSRDRGEKEQEMDRHEREAERERLRKEREHRRKLEDAERAYQTRLRQWERKEREKEKERQYEKEKEKERERKRKKEIRYEEEEDEDDDDSRRRWHRGAEERRRRRQREKEDDLADRLKEEEEAAEAKRIAEEQKLQQQQLDALRLLSGHAAIGSEPIQASTIENDTKTTLQTAGESFSDQHASGVEQNGSGNEMSMAVDNNSGSEAHAPSKKLGFGLVGSGKRTSVPSVFYEEDEEEAHKDKKMKPLVPIDYSAEEQEAVAHGGSGNTPPPHLALAAEFAKRISSSNPKEETTEAQKHRSSKRSHDKPSHREREREKDRDRARDRGDGHGGSTKESGKAKTPDTKKLMDAKQLIDTIPKTKEELFSYEINWAMYDEHQLHERMRPWISKKIMEFLGEEEATLVDFIVSNTQQHVKASQMLELLQSILDEEAEMFVLKMWRMLIFEIKRVEAGVPR
ncbi:RNA-binding motif protein 25 isoform X2 [Raphanus sativus]|nr:RNA-binding motif protein 25 isoform X2 [Raphanus sativus]XP_018439277.1 PREDICTED: RNA-binding protein 25 isoform X2 [Raphanus sativus]XP_056845407.1 RNA-binding motif protein 25 isoform X3 [Raphanus sativus]XP_056845408.1 RNA-binding motif protein 25 isoform X3 [Raphanus sativus]XP_056853108.1 RNA-binding motif protein 25 isoform X2 [Raphanus sativus]XP_056853109.1 RNA-binding motif protein 25 isoform X2 [Raphanus sativus]XP_056853110.1 RNA-binding motif protein 25 isoform X2 [Raphanus s